MIAPIAALMLILAAGPALAQLKITITKGVEGAQPIAIVPFGFSGAAPDERNRIASVIADDLARTGRFAPIPFGDLPSRPVEPDEVNFNDWKLLRTGNLVIGSVRPVGGDAYTVEFRLFDVYRGKQLAGFQYDASARDLRRIGHQISDLIYEKLTGERGAFDTRVAYVTEESSGGSNRRYALNVADSDGYDSFTILESNEPILSPSWSPDGTRLAYVSYEGGRTRVFVQELASGARNPVTSFPGINGAPAWSPDGRRLAVTLSKDGNPEIYVVEVATRRLRRVTSHGGIDTEPTWAPDGRSLVFTSDRGGQPQLYRVSLSGGQPERVTFEGKYNARAAFSPDGERLAFVHNGGKGGFRIAVLELANGAMRVLTRTRLDESPTFAPNGSLILYATVDRGVSTLAAVSTDGRVHQQLAVRKGKVREPAWSPFRPR